MIIIQKKIDTRRQMLIRIKDMKNKNNTNNQVQKIIRAEVKFHNNKKLKTKYIPIFQKKKYSIKKSTKSQKRLYLYQKALKQQKVPYKIIKEMKPVYKQALCPQEIAQQAIQEIEIKIINKISIKAQQKQTILILNLSKLKNKKKPKNNQNHSQHNTLQSNQKNSKSLTNLTTEITSKKSRRQNMNNQNMINKIIMNNPYCQEWKDVKSVIELLLMIVQKSIRAYVQPTKNPEKLEDFTSLLPKNKQFVKKLNLNLNGEISIKNFRPT